MTQPATTAPPPQRMSAAELAALLALVQAQAAVRQRLTDTAIAAALAPFRTFNGWFDKAKVDKAITQVLKILQPTQRQAAQATDAYLTRVARIMTGRTTRPVGAIDVTRLRTRMTPQVAEEILAGRRQPAFLELGDTVDGPGPDIQTPVALALRQGARPTTTRAGTPATQPAREQTAQEAVGRRAPDTALRAGRAAAAQRQAAAGRTARTAPAALTRASRLPPVVALDPAEVYGRIADTYRFQVAQGADEATALRKALVRVSVAAETDVTLAVRAQWEKNLGNIKGITGYRRILHPEKGEGGPACGLCVVAADRLYRIQELAPIHSNCRCEVLPVIGDKDPGFSLNADDMSALYDAGGGNRAKDLIKVKVALAEHGELGPTLIDAGQNFRGPADVAKTLLRRAT